MIGSALGRYQIVSKLGEGGMATVYRATDPALGRDVAVKVLPQEVSADPGRLERFRREARALAALNHPHIVTIYSVEETDGVLFLTMELLTGQTLDKVIGGTPMPIARVQEIGAAVADALAAAHAARLIHRDLKPANIVVGGGGQTKVLDFGLAKSSPVSKAEASTHLGTHRGAVLGTPAYMAPEQVSGHEADERTDIFALGVVLYEMVTGVRPFSGHSSAELATAILRDTPTPVGELRPTVPQHLADLISRSLEKNASSRVSSMVEVRAVLQSAGATATHTGPSVAVLPFKNLSADSDSEFFGDGLAEEILNALARIGGLRVAARTSSFSFKGLSVPVSEIGTRLRVGHVLDGSVRRLGNRIRVTAQLINATDGFQLWAERYDREIADVFDVQEEIARALADRLLVTLASGSPPRLVRPLTTNLEAYELYLRGRALLYKRGRHVAEGTEHLKRAVELDPTFAAAWAGLADTFAVRGYFGDLAAADAMPKALTAARRAVALDPNLSEAQCALAIALLMWERNYQASQAAFARCLELNPDYTQGRCWYALFQRQWISGELRDGVAEARRAHDGDPLSAYAASILGMTLGVAGETDEGMLFARLGVERDPDAMLSHWVLGLVAHWHREFQESVDAFVRAAQISNRTPFTLSHQAIAWADWGRVDQARALHDELLAMRARAPVPFTSLAISAAAVGDLDAAFEFAHQACDEREGILVVFARNFPDLSRLRADSRFARILERLALPAQ